MDQRETKKGRKPVLKRKHFIIALVAVCAIALIAEGVLLAHTFRKKSKSGDTQKNGNQNSAVIEVPDGYQKVWKVTGRTWYGSYTEEEEKTVFEYDEFGRLKTMKSFYEDGAEEYIEWKYEKSGRRVNAWLLEKGTPRTDENIHSMAFEVIPGPGGINAFSWVYVRNINGISLEYDEDGYWKSVTALYPEGNSVLSPIEEYTFSYDSQRRINGWTKSKRDDDDEQKMITTDIRLEYDENNPNRIIQYWAVPDEKVIKRIFENGRKVMEGETPENGEFRVTSDWTYSENGFLCNNYNEDGSIWKTSEEYEISLGIPNYSRGYDRITFKCETHPDNYSERFVKDDQGRITGVIRRRNDSEETMVQAEYDDKGRIISYTEYDEKTTFSYDENGNLAERITTDLDKGKVIEEGKYKYTEIVVPIS